MSKAFEKIIEGLCEYAKTTDNTQLLKKIEEVIKSHETSSNDNDNPERQDT